jgi:hypothetical protein
MTNASVPAERLLPCPFCGSPASIEPWHNAKHGHLVSCSNREGDNYCRVGPGVAGDTKAEAIELWNRRAEAREEGKPGCWFVWPDRMPNGPQKMCTHPVVGMREGHPCCALHQERKVPEGMGITEDPPASAANTEGLRTFIVSLRDWFNQGAEKATHPADRAWNEEVVIRLNSALNGKDPTRLDAALRTPPQKPPLSDHDFAGSDGGPLPQKPKGNLIDCPLCSGTGEYGGPVGSKCPKCHGKAQITSSARFVCKGCGKEMDPAYEAVWSGGTARHWDVKAQAWCGPVEKQSKLGPTYLEVDMNRYTFDDISCAFDDEDLETREFVKASDVVAMESDAQTLRGYIKTHGETPAMTWSTREHWKNRAERAEADIEKLKMDAEHLQYERDEAREANVKPAGSLRKAEDRIDKSLLSKVVGVIVNERLKVRRLTGEGLAKSILDVIFPDGTEDPPSSWPTNEAESAALAEARKESTP